MKETDTQPMTIRATLAFAWSIVRGHKIMLYGMMGCAALFAAVEIILPLIGKVMFDGIAAYGTADEISTDTVWQLAYTFFGFNVAFWVFRYGMFFVWIPFSAAYIRRLVETAFVRVQQFSTAWHNDTFAGVTVRNITRGMWALDGLLDILLTQFFPTFLVILGTSVYMAASGHIYMGAALALFLVLFMGTTGAISLKVVAPLNQSANEADSRLGGMLADAVTCNAAVKAFGTEDLEYGRIRNALDVWQARKFKAWYASTGNGMLQTTLTVAMRAGFVFAVLYEWTQSRATLGDVYFCFSITSVINAYLRDFGAQLRNLQNHINDLDPVAAYMRMVPAVADAPDALPLKASAGEIRFENVSFGYKPGLPSLFDALSVTIAAGKTTALVGRSGSGKTSFVKLVQRLYDVQGGRILIDGHDIAKVTQQSLHGAIALVPQDPVLFHRTLAENIAYARPDCGMDAVRAAAHDANIGDFIRGLPEGYDTMVGERGVKLSGGERQRVAIARAIVAQRPILIMDEATSSLDSVSEAAIQSALDTLTRGRTTLVIAHRLSTIRRADTILVFEGGKIVEAGPHDALLANETGVYRRLYDAQTDGLIV